MDRRKRSLLVLGVVGLAVGSTAMQAQAVSITWDAGGAGGAITNGGGGWLTAGLWNNAGVAANWTSGDDATFAGPATAGGAVTLAGPTTVNSLTFNPSFTGTYTLGTAGQTITLSNGITKNAGSGAVSIVSPITLGAAQTWTNNSTTGLTTSNGTNLINNGGFQLTVDGTGSTTFGVLNNAANTLMGSGALVKNGTGKLFIGGDNSQVGEFTGNVTINGGVLHYGDFPGSLGTGNLLITNGMIESRWTTGFTKTQGAGAGQIQITGGESGFAMNGDNSVTFNIGAITWGSATFNPTKFLLQNSASQNNAHVTIASAINLNGADRTIVVNGGTIGAARATITGAISNSTGTAGLIKEGAGLLTLTGTNTYNGATTISGGTLTLSWAGSTSGGSIMPSSSITMAQGTTLNFNPVAQSNAGNSGTNAYTYGGPINLTGAAGTATMTFAKNDTKYLLSGNVTGAAGVAQTLAIVQGGSSTGAGDRQNILYSGVIADGSGGGTLGLNINFAGASGTTQTAFVNLSGQNTFTGPIVVTNTKGLTGGAFVTIGGEKWSASHGGGAQGSGFIGGGNYTNTISLASGIILDYFSSANQTLGGAISGAGSILKEGTGALTLSGNNSYAGTTTVTAGILAQNGTYTGGGDFIVNSGGTLQGSGTANGDLIVNSGGTVAPGNSIESLGGFASFTFAGGSTFAYEIDTTATASVGADLLFGADNSTLTIGSGALLNLSDFSGTNTFLAPGTKFTLIAYDGLWNGGIFTGFADDSAFVFAGNFWRINYNDTSAGLNFFSDASGLNTRFVTITSIVPEPASLSLLMLGSLALLGRRTKDHRQMH